MSIEKKNKDHLKEHGEVSLVPPAPLKSDDPLKFWTSHPTQSRLVNLRPFAEGEFTNPNPNGPNTGNWGGAYTGRPELIAELMPALEARCALLGDDRVRGFLTSLRMWWRLFDSIEAMSLGDGQPVTKVSSVGELNVLHEVQAKQSGMNAQNFRDFQKIADDVRIFMRLPKLGWIPPENRTSESHLIPEKQARDLKVALKQNWERVRKTWARNDRIRGEAGRRAAGESPTDLTEEEEHLLKNWQHFHQAQLKTGLSLPTANDLGDRSFLSKRGLKRRLMRSILFPTVEEADIAFHLALQHSGWNPSTLARVDATNPFVLANHPKEDGQLVLNTEAGEDEEATLHAVKPRANGQTQFCIGKKSHLSSAPMIVEAYLKRVGPLREILKENCKLAQLELARLHKTGADQSTVSAKVKHIQTLQESIRSVWLYVDLKGDIGSLSWTNWRRYESPNKTKGTLASYLDLVRYQLNAQRGAEDHIPNVTPSDFRDIYTRWVMVQSNGNILAVMLALGHKSPSTTVNYLRSKIYREEHDDQIRRFMIHLFDGLGRGEIDLTKLSQNVRHGEITPEMEARLAEYRLLMRSRIGVGCADPRHPPENVAPGHVAGRLCGTQRCLYQCEHARFLPEALNGIAMRVEELVVMSDYLPREPWLRGEYQEELEMGEELLEHLFPSNEVAEARTFWRERILTGEHLIPGLGHIDFLEDVI